MAKTKKITDLKGQEIRIQASADRQFVDLYLGPEKTRIFRHSKPIAFKWWTVHRVFKKVEAEKLLTRMQLVVKSLKLSPS